MQGIKWPLTILVGLALVIVGAVLLAGPALGVPDATQEAVLEWVGGAGAILGAPLAALLAYLARDGDKDGAPRVLDRDDSDPEVQ